MEEKSFTIRLPIDLVDKLDMRTQLNLRSRTKEIQALLVYALDNLAEDAVAAREQAGRSLSDQSQSSEE